MFKYLFFLVAITSTFQACNSSQENEVPNIVYILADDLGYGDVSVYNPESKIQTPNMIRNVTRKHGNETSRSDVVSLGACS